MRFKHSEHRLTRVIIDSSQSLELADLPLVMSRIHQELHRQAPLAPPQPIDSALLSLAAYRCFVEDDESMCDARSSEVASYRVEGN